MVSDNLGLDLLKSVHQKLEFWVVEFVRKNLQLIKFFRSSKFMSAFLTGCFMRFCHTVLGQAGHFNVHLLVVSTCR